VLEGLEMLPRDEIHVWAKELEASPSLTEHPSLSIDERSKAATFRFHTDGARYAACRVFLREILSRYLGAPPEELPISFGPHGKPQVAGIEFSLSHAGGLCLIAMGRNRVGVDVERPIEGPAAPLLATRIMSAAERDRWAALRETERGAVLARAWTMKEAFGKALGTGLTPQIEKSPLPSRPWRFQDLDLGPDVIGTVVAEGSDWTVVVKTRTLALC
jgi:4'-phosphopantetheinyl transferase